MLKFKYLAFITLVFTLQANSQDLISLLDENEIPPITYVQGTFKGVRLINGYTSETPGKKDLVFSISHRFNPVNEGFYEFFGLDNSTIRFGFEYGLTDRLSLGLGRSNYEKQYDGFLKYKMFRQEAQQKGFPLTITWMSMMTIKTLKWPEDGLEYPDWARYYYVHEVFIARKFNHKFSAQMVPLVVVRNMVETEQQQNIVPAMGFGANYTINHWLSVSGEYYYLFPGNTADNFENSLALGVEMETGGGHIFQINLSNASGMTEKVFVPETIGRWLDGDIAIGFNIIRIFHTHKKRK